MKHSLKISAVLAAVAALGTTALADSPVGTWKGKMELNLPQMQGNMPPEAKAAMTKQLEAIKKMVMNLSLNKDKTWKMTFQGMPAGAPGADKPQEGTWTQKGNDITLVAKKDPKNPGSSNPITLKLTGKTMTFVPPGGAGQGKLTFTKS